MWAHSVNRHGVGHDLVDHLLSVAQLARKFGSSFGMENWAYVAGLFHDLGKAHPEFQEYLKNPFHKRTIRDHSSAGAVFLSRFTGVVLPFVIAGHHSGLVNLVELRSRLKERKKDPDVCLSIRLGLEEMSRRGIDYANEILFIQEKQEFYNDPLRDEVLIRMLFSCLVDADYLDTECHFHPGRAEQRERWHGSMSELFQMLEEHQRRLRTSYPDTLLNATRAHIYDACIEASRHPTGIFKLSLPTGMGKTVSSMGFALSHAITHNKDRVIVVIPYTSIIEQTAQTYREIFGDHAVLEHHSVVEPGIDQETEEMRMLATENWNAPIVVTTTVQFFESLFGNRSSVCRKLHNIANSVVILDEFQMLPLELLDACFSIIETLTSDYGVTFVLSSATPMALNFHHYSPVRDIVPEPDDIFKRFRRVMFQTQHLRQSMSWREVAELVARHKQALIVVNRRRDAWTLYSLLRQQCNDVWHLSSLMCPKHRRKVLQIVRDRLERDLPVVLVSTQLIEAGVDIDFPVVMRSVAPLDRIVQAAGRCNREGRLEKGQVILFEPLECGIPKGSYDIGTRLTKNLILDGRIDLLAFATYEKYFRMLYQSVDTDAKRIEALRRQSPFQFSEIAKRFKMIDEETATVVVKYDENSYRLIARLDKEGAHYDLLRQLQPYVVNVYRTDPIFDLQSDKLEELFPGWYVFNGLYDEETGLAASMNYTL